MEIEMPKDARLYMTFPNDFHKHPKITRLPIEARWAFIVLNGEARLADNDGVFDLVDAIWLLADHVDNPEQIVSALAKSHPTRPLVVVDESAQTLVIRDYAEHQQTRSEREALSEKRRAAGTAGRAKQMRASAGQVPSTSPADAGPLRASLGRDRDRDTSSNDEVHTRTEGEVEIADHGNAIDAEFESIWQAWPRKNDKRTAHRRWSALSAAKRAEIIPLLVTHANAHRLHTPTQFVPYLATWLNQERWNDPLPESRGQSTSALSNVQQNRDVLARYANENQN